VLASVSIDESGVVRGAENAGKSVNRMESQFAEAEKVTRRSADSIAAFGEHMTSTAAIARSLGHTIGVAGLGLGVIELTKSLIEGTSAWKDFTSGLHEYMDTALRGISVTQELDAQFAKLASDAGIKGSAIAIREENEKATAALKALQDQGDPSSWRLMLV